MNVHTRLILGMLLVPVLATGAGSSVWLDVPYVHQEKEGCGSAALAMILQYWSQRAPRFRQNVSTRRKFSGNCIRRKLTESAPRQWRSTCANRAFLLLFFAASGTT